MFIKRVSKKSIHSMLITSKPYPQNMRFVSKIECTLDFGSS